MSADETSKTPNTIEDLQVGAKLPGKVTSVELYGAFVDIGAGRDALGLGGGQTKQHLPTVKHSYGG